MVLPSPDILGESMSTGAVDPMSLLGFDPAVQPSAHMHVPRAENLAAGSGARGTVLRASGAGARVKRAAGRAWRRDPG